MKIHRVPNIVLNTLMWEPPEANVVDVAQFHIGAAYVNLLTDLDAVSDLYFSTASRTAPAREAILSSGMERFYCSEGP